MYVYCVPKSTHPMPHNTQWFHIHTCTFIHIINKAQPLARVMSLLANGIYVRVNGADIHESVEK